MNRILTLIITSLITLGAFATENLTLISNGFRGPVKSVKMVVPGVSSEYLEFDRQGRVIKEINNQGMIATYDWGEDTFTVNLTDADGNPVGTPLTYVWMYNDNTFFVITSEDRYVAYNDDGNGVRLMKVVVADGKTAVYQYHYDDNGVLTSADVVSPDGTAPEMQMSIVSENIDSHGNPTRQTGKVLPSGPEYKSLYKITYYDE